MRFDRSAPTATRSNRSDGRHDGHRRDRHAGDEGRHEHPLRAGLAQRRHSLEERESLADLRELGIHPG
jgi:hypothetical protein